VISLFPLAYLSSDSLTETKGFISESCTQRHNTESLKHILPEKELLGLSPNFHIYVSVSDLYIPAIGLTILLQENMRTDLGNI
jgi:hypothetical protein